ncbi:hypothetical protein [Rhizobium ruizarguesonis]|jgi:hypothetical protein|uniref:hypothetical protein n=1 Tax=Rhizobium ruizarguesonis TaxID=2081791 RepID=UPI0018D5181C|nr:hypothetical protein [Rhizobium ruizarguesonis]
MNKLLICCLASVVLTSCADYLNHRDTITFGAGNAMEANKAIHIAQPFNPQSQSTRIYADGRRVGRVMTEYNGGGSVQGGQQPYDGNCPTEDDTAADGSRCGGRAASVQ